LKGPQRQLRPLPSNWQNIWPLVLSTTIGIPIGVILLNYINPVYFRFGVGVLLVLYTIYGSRHPIRSVRRPDR
jgi:uncharacterized membrane protein YfcA